MKSNGNRMFFFFLLLLCVAAGNNLFAQTNWTGGGADNNWSTALNWDSGIPDNLDDVTIPQNSTVVIDVNAQCKSLTFNDAGGVGGNTSITASANVTLTLYGNLTLTRTDDQITISQGAGTLNLAFAGNGNITTGADADITVNNLTLNNAAVNLIAGTLDDDLIVLGNIDLIGTSSLSDGGTDVRLVLNSGGTQTITVAGTSSFSISDLYIDGAATAVQTASDLTIEEFDLNNGSFVQSSGTTTITGNSAYAAGTAEFFNIDFDASSAGITWNIPSTVKGTFNKSGVNTLTLSDAITFNNVASRSLTCAGGIVTFENIIVSNNSDITTTSSFSIGDGTNGSTFTVNTGASFIASGGTQTLNGTGTAVDLVNNSGTLTLNALNCSAGNITLNGSATCSSLDIGATARFDAKDGTSDVLTASGNITVTIGGLIGNTLPSDILINGACGITTGADSDISINDLTISNVAVTLTANTSDDDLIIKGDLSITGTGSLTDGGNDVRLVFNSAGTQNITVASGATFSVPDIYIDVVGTDVRTSSTLYIEELDVNNGAFTQTAGTTYITSSPIYNAGTVQFFNLNVNTTAAPITWPMPMTIAGNFTQTGANTLAVSATTTISNSTSKVFSFVANQVSLDVLDIQANSDITTSSTFSFNGGASISVSNGGSFVASSSSNISIDPTGGFTITNNGGTDSDVSFYDLTLLNNVGTVTTATDMLITGDLSVPANATFDATAGIVKFDNIASRNITVDGTLIFCNLEIDAGSTVISDKGFYISNNNTAQSSGITVDASSSLSFTDPTATVIFGHTTENAQNKSIVNNGTLTFMNLSSADLGNNNVVTSDNFTIAGTSFDMGSANGATFTASGGQITFSGNCLIAGHTALQVTLWDVITSGTAQVTLNAGDLFSIKGDVTVNSTSTFKAAGNSASVTFDGTSLQTVGGNSSASFPISFGILVINKTQNSSPADYINLELDTEIQSGGALTLTDGILDLGTIDFKVADANVSYTNGRINGNTGTYIVAATHTSLNLSDVLFTPDIPSGTNASLYNLQLGDDATGGDNETLDGDLTINNDLILLGGDLDLGANTLTVSGNITHTTLAEKITFSTGKVVLDGSGTVSNLSNTLFTGATAPNIEFQREETLSGDLTFTNTDLTLNSTTGNLLLETYTLLFTGTGQPIILSGSMDADQGEIILTSSTTEIPASMFVDDKVDRITIGTLITLFCNLEVLTSISGDFDLNTGEYYLDLSSGATHPFDKDDNVIGRLRKTVSGTTATLYELGCGNSAGYTPLEIKFNNSTNSQVVEVSSEQTSPVYGRTGDQKRAFNIEWYVNPIGSPTNTNDSVQINFGWGSGLNNDGLSAVNNETFSARWLGSEWEDFRNSHLTGAGAVGNADDGISMASYISYPLSADDFSGYYAIFDALSSSDSDKDAALALPLYKLECISQPTITDAGSPFDVVFQLQNQYGYPDTTDTPLNITITVLETCVTLTNSPITVVMPANSDRVTVPGLMLHPENSINAEIKAVTTYKGYSTYGVSGPIDILQTEPLLPCTNLNLSAITATSMTVSFSGTGTAHDKAIIVAKLDSTIVNADFPQDGETYSGNTVFGAGSQIGNGLVIYNGDGEYNHSFSLSGLVPGRRYSFRIFSYQGANGTENYNHLPGNLTTRSATTLSGTDDDVVFGSNDTESDAKLVGTNEDFQGLIDSDSDEDWFRFLITSASTNVKVKLTNVPANYNLEMYNSSGRRIRRAFLNGLENEYLVINNLNTEAIKSAFMAKMELTIVLILILLK